MYGNEQMVIFTLHLHISIAQFRSILSWIYILASSMPIRQHRWFTVNFSMLKAQELFFIWHFISCQHKHLAIGEILFTNQEDFYITYNLMNKNFPESGRLSNLCTQIGLFSLKIRKSSAESGRVASSAELYEEVNIFKLHIFDVEITTYSFPHIGKSNLRIKE